jgi:hypothetical protein
LAAFSNDDTPEKVIIGKWRMDTVATRSNMNKIFKPSDNEQADKFALGMMEMMLQMMGNSTIEFKEGGELETIRYSDDGEDPKVYKGTWKISKKNDEIIMTENGQETKMKIISVSKEKAELGYSKRDEAPWILVYLPEK